MLVKQKRDELRELVRDVDFGNDAYYIDLGLKCHNALIPLLDYVDQLEAQCAAMRAALEMSRPYKDDCPIHKWDLHCCHDECAFKVAISSDAGRDLLDRYKALEAVEQAARNIGLDILEDGTPVISGGWELEQALAAVEKLRAGK